jgi:hypothetical protein
VHKRSILHGCGIEYVNEQQFMKLLVPELSTLCDVPEAGI